MQLQWELDDYHVPCVFAEELMLLNCGVGEALESPRDWKEIQHVHPKGDQSWIFFGRTDAEAETPILWQLDSKSWLFGKRPWCRERSKVGGEGDNRGWNGWIALLTQWTWVWASSRSWSRTGNPFPSMGCHRPRHDWATEVSWTEEMEAA